MTGPEYLKHTSGDIVERKQLYTNLAKKGKSKRIHLKTAQTGRAKSLVERLKKEGW